MKKTLIVVAVAILSACNTKPTSTTEPNSVALADTTNLNHNANADKPAEIRLNGVSDTIISKDGNEYVKVKPNEVVPAAVPPAVVPVRHQRSEHVATSATHIHHTTITGSPSGSESSQNSTVSSGSSSDANSTSKTTTPETVSEPRAKYSKAEKGAVIGAGAGAVAGAIISKKKGVGAILGGVIGAGGGYIIGSGKDKKDGRY